MSRRKATLPTLWDETGAPVAATPGLPKSTPAPRRHPCCGLALGTLRRMGEPRTADDLWAHKNSEHLRHMLVGDRPALAEVLRELHEAGRISDVAGAWEVVPGQD